MRKLVTAAATALTLALGLASPALADHNSNNNNYPYQGGQQDQYYDNGASDNQYNNGRYRNYDFGRNNGNFDRWDRSWGYDRRFDNQYRFHKPMSLRKLIRSLAYQGYYGVRNLERARWGWGYRAFAFDRSGRPVMLRVNPYTGQIMDVRYI
jgi:hypothetical protein